LIPAVAEAAAACHLPGRPARTADPPFTLSLPPSLSLPGDDLTTRRASPRKRFRVECARFARAWARVQPERPLDPGIRRTAATPHCNKGPRPETSRVEGLARLKWIGGLGAGDGSGTKTTNYMCFPAMRRHTSRPTCLRMSGAHALRDHSSLRRPLDALVGHLTPQVRTGSQSSLRSHRSPACGRLRPIEQGRDAH